VTVMRRVRALEAALGTTLFVRRRDGHRLTEAGADLAATAREAEDLLSVVGRSTDRDRRIEGRVRIATTEVGANWILLPALPSFLGRTPGLSVEIDADPDAADLLEDGVSMALRFHRPQSGAYAVKRLGAMPVALYAAPTVAAIAEAHGLSGLSPIGWAGGFAEIGLARWLRSLFTKEPAVRLTTMQGQLTAAKLGLGVAALPVIVGQSEPRLTMVRSAQSFALEAWLVLPNQTRRHARTRVAAAYCSSVGHGCA